MEYYQMVLAEIISRWTFIVNAILTFATKYFNILDDSIGIITGVLAVVGGIMWTSVLVVKRRQAKIELEIKQIELQKLKKENEQTT